MAAHQGRDRAHRVAGGKSPRRHVPRDFGIIRYGKVEDVADLVTFIVSSRATWLHGATIDLDGGEIPVL